jgi:hypothetical protein
MLQFFFPSLCARFTRAPSTFHVKEMEENREELTHPFPERKKEQEHRTEHKGTSTTLVRDPDSHNSELARSLSQQHWDKHDQVWFTQRNETIYIHALETKSHNESQIPRNLLRTPCHTHTSTTSVSASIYSHQHTAIAATTAQTSCTWKT